MKSYEEKKSEKEREQQRKLMIINAAKKFKVHQHANQIMKEDPSYLKALSNHVTK